ncbi:MAG: putative COP9 signalosome complex subunit 2, partial [Streblomastix strix]
MHLQGDFQEAFRSYDQFNSPQRIPCLKYLLLASMLTGSVVNPMEAPETRNFQNDPQIISLAKLIAAFQRKDTDTFYEIVKNDKNITNDEIVKKYVDDLIHDIRVSKLKQIIRPFTSVKIKFLSDELKWDPSDLERNIAILIMDGHIDGKLDQIQGMLFLGGTGKDKSGGAQSGSQGAGSKSADDAEESGNEKYIAMELLMDPVVGSCRPASLSSSLKEGKKIHIVEKAPKANPMAIRKFQQTEFRRFYDRGDLPVAV